MDETIVMPGDSQAPMFRLYSPGQIAAATLFSGPVAGCWLMARNFKAFGEPEVARRTWALGILSTAAVLAIALVVPNGSYMRFLPPALSVAVHQIARSTQGARFQAHLRAGGRRHSHWRVAGLTLVFTIAVLAAILVAVLMLPERLVREL